MLKLRNTISYIIFASALSIGASSYASHSHEFVQADISGGAKSNFQPMINKCLDEVDLKLQKKSKKTLHSVYRLERNDPDTYHLTLDSIIRKDGKSLGPQDHLKVVELINSFKAKSADSSQNKPGFKSYKGEGFELRLYAHFKEGGVQHYALNPSKHVLPIEDLLKTNKTILYCNLVVKHGTAGKLKKDWEEFRKKKLNAHPFYTTKGQFPKLDTHMTVGNIYKYAGNNTKLPFENMHDKKTLVAAFRKAASNYKNDHDINVNRLTIRANGEKSHVWLKEKGHKNKGK